MFFRNLALEEDIIQKTESQTIYTDSMEFKSRIRVLNYAPGPLDTQMQEQIRRSMPPVPTRIAFEEMHRNKTLIDPQVSAAVLIKLLENDTYENGAHIDYFDVKDLAEDKTVGH